MEEVIEKKKVKDEDVITSKFSLRNNHFMTVKYGKWIGYLHMRKWNGDYRSRKFAGGAEQSGSRWNYRLLHFLFTHILFTIHL